MSDNDDAQVGRILTRREVLGLLGVAGAAVIVGCTSDSDPAPSATATAGQSSAVSTSGGSSSSAAAASTAVPSCVVTPALTEGPYFVDEKLDRSDIRADPSNGVIKEGTLLTLTLNVSRVATGSCSPLSGAVVDVWHCDALGVYSDVVDGSFNTRGQKFLRGYQTTDNNGQVKFTTIYPGWYPGRSVHIHFKVRQGASEFTSQFFFDESLTDQVYTQAPYTQKPAGGRTRNERDGIYNQSRSQLQLNVTRSGQAYAATFDIGMQTA
jgi:protocatechuate 3,4-dioxygenase beta subunit